MSGVAFAGFVKCRPLYRATTLLVGPHLRGRRYCRVEVTREIISRMNAKSLTGGKIVGMVILGPEVWNITAILLTMHPIGEFQCHIKTRPLKC